MDRIVVTEDVQRLGIKNPVGCLISGLEVRSGASELDEHVEKLERKISENSEEILSREEVSAYHDVFEAVGHPGQEPAGEQLVRLIREQGLNRHNNVVDAYNIASAERGMGLGMHDVTALSGDVYVHRASGGERILPIFHEQPVQATTGDVLHEVGGQILGILGPVDRDAGAYRVTEATDQALLLSLGNEKTAEEDNRAVCRRAYDLICETCPDATLTFLDVRTRDATDADSAVASP
ncbi:phenylalanine--tRNA ligase beta subunit-related protein [Halocatena pleomorpha]|nr:phenylalanine--tRNA ligase beta subunit-related protein [Halocatena pleomorpha]